MGLPENIENLLLSSKYLHLGTCSDNSPDVALMNYTYIPKGDASPQESSSCIVMTSPKNSQKFKNIQANPNVSILVHDWTTARSMVESSEGVLSQMLRNLNQASLSNLSVSLSGTAKIVTDGEAAKFFKDKHAANNDGKDAKTFINENTDVILVTVKEATMTDVENNSKTYTA